MRAGLVFFDPAHRMVMVIGGRSMTIWTRPTRSHARCLASWLLHAACWLLWHESWRRPVFSFQTQKRDTSVPYGMMASGICSLICSVRCVFARQAGCRRRTLPFAFLFLMMHTAKPLPELWYFFIYETNVPISVEIMFGNRTTLLLQHRKEANSGEFWPRTRTRCCPQILAGPDTGPGPRWRRGISKGHVCLQWA